MNYSNLIASLEPAVISAGAVIMEIYERADGHDIKDDGSPVTEADKAAEKILLEALGKFAPEIPVVSEENPESHKLPAPDTFFLVDPLDGTREFVRRDGKGAFTVNIGLIENGEPTLGIVHAPALNKMFHGAKCMGAFENHIPIKTMMPESGKPIAVASQSHRDPETDQWLKNNAIEETISIGSSIKFCLLANGQAHLYPRFSPTMEWDTAAGDAILRAAGGMVSSLDGKDFSYGKPEYRNGNFLAKSSLRL